MVPNGLLRVCAFSATVIGRCVDDVLVAEGWNSYRGRVGGLQSTAITDKLAEHLRRGELLDLAPDLTLGSPVDEVVMTSWDGTHSIAADDVRDLLCGRVVTDPDPRGLRLRGARIRGRLDLDNLCARHKDPGMPSAPSWNREGVIAAEPPAGWLDLLSPVPSHPAGLCVASTGSRAALAPSRSDAVQAPLMPARRRRTIPGPTRGRRSLRALQCER